MHHFLYITRLKNSSKYYVGRHSTTNINDTYFGSGKWIKSIQDKSALYREIVQFCDNEKELKQKEKILIETHINNKDCMNFNENSCGFSSKNNPMKLESNRRKTSIRMTENNITKNGHTAETKEKISYYMKHNNPTKDPAVRQKISDNLKGKNVGKVRSQELKDFFSKQRKEKYARGELVPTYGFLGKKHSKEYKEKMSNIFKNKPDVECVYCGLKMKKQQHSRWHGEKCKMNRLNV